VSYDTPEKPSAPLKKSSMQSASLFDREKKLKTVHVAAPAKRPPPAATVRCTWHIDYLFSTMHLSNFTCVIVLDICLHSSKKAKKLARDENMASTARADRLAEAKAAMFSPKIPAHT
jgi:hypothetical protein